MTVLFVMAGGNMANRFIDATLRFIDNFTGPMGQAIKKMEESGKAYKRAGKQIEDVGKSIANTGKTLTTTVTVPVATLGISAVKTAAEFEQSMSKVASITGDTGNATKELVALANEMGLSYQKNADGSASAMDILSAKALQMGAKTKFSAMEAADAFSYMAMAGWDTQSMLEGIEGIMYLAGATGEDLALTSDIVTDALTAFGMAASDTSRFVDVLAQTANRSNTDVAMMGETFQYVAPLAGALGYSVEDTAVAIGLMANSGIKASNAGTALRSLFTNLAKPTDSMTIAMEKLGISLTDSSGEMKTLDALMREMRGAFSELTESQKAQYAATIAGKMGMSGLLAIVNASEDDFNKLTAAMGESAGAAKAMYDVANDNLIGRLTILKSTLESIAIAFGNRLLPYVEKGVEKLQLLAEKFNSLSDEQMDSIIKWAAIAASIGPALMLFGKVVTSIGSVVSMMGKFGLAVKKAGGFMALLTSPAGIVVGVLAAIVAATVLVVKNIDRIKPVLSEAKNWFIATFGESIKKAIADFQGILGKVVREVQAGLPGAIQVAKSALGTFTPIIDAVVSAAKTMLPEAVNLLKVAFGEIGPITKTAVDSVLKTLPGITGTIKNVAKAAAPVIESLVGTIVKVVPMIASAFVDVAKQLAPVVKTISAVIKAAIPVVMNLLSGAFKIAGEAIIKMLPYVLQVANVIGEAIVFAVQKAAPLISQFAGVVAAYFDENVNKIGKFIAVVKSIWEIIQPAVKGIGQQLKFVFEIQVGTAIGIAIGAFESVVQTAKEMFNGLSVALGGILEFISGVFTGNWTKAWEGVKSIFSGIFTAITALAKSSINGVISIVNGAISGINKMGITIPDWVPKLGGKAFKINIPPIPMLYKGTSNWGGGPAMIHDRGAEIVDLPKGTRVYPHDKSIQMARAEGSKSVVVNIPKLAETIVIREDADIDKVIDALVRKLEDVAPNMA